jgi:hypothetical protein
MVVTTVPVPMAVTTVPVPMAVPKLVATVIVVLVDVLGRHEAISSN